MQVQVPVVPVLCFMPTCKNTFFPVLHRKKKIEGLLQNFKSISLFEIVVRTGISLPKIYGFYILVLFLCYAAVFAGHEYGHDHHEHYQ
jgi:hypothetical protein